MHLTKKTLILLSLFIAAPQTSALASDIVRLHVESGVTSATEGTKMLTLDLRDDSRRDLARFTREHLMKQVDLVIDGKVVGSPVIREVLEGPSVSFGIPMSDAERSDLVARLIRGEATLEMRTHTE